MPSNSLGLVGHWTFDGKDMIDNVADSSGQGNDGDLSFSATTTAPGVSGQALAVNGNGQNVSVPTSSSLQNLSSFTISFWIKTTGLNSTSQSTLVSDEAFPNSGFDILDNGSFSTNIQFRTDNGTNHDLAIPRSLVNDGSWHYLTFTTDGSTKWIYLDGQPYTSAAIGGYTVNNTSAITMAKIQGNQGGGTMDDVRIYNRALSASEIAQLYRASAASRQGVTPGYYRAPGDTTTGLVAWWKFDNGSGTSATDSSGNANTGTLNGTFTWTAGQIGGALSFNGTNQYVDVTSAASLNMGTAATISAWFKPTGLTTGYILNKWTNNLEDKQLQFVSNGQVQFYLFNTFGGTALQSSSILQVGSWYHIVGIYDGSKAYLYINGKLDAEKAASGDVSDGSGDLYIGRNPARLSGNLTGVVDDLRIYSRALSANDVRQLYEDGTGVHTSINPEPGLVGHWTFDGKDMNSDVSDTSGQGNDGDLVGFTSTTTTQGVIGQALSFNGTSQYLNLGSPASLNLYTNYAISFWVKPSSLSSSGGGPVISRSDSTHNTYLCALSASTNTVLFSWWTGSVSEVLTSNTALPTGKWSHVVCLASGGKQWVYINGSLDNNRTYGSTAASATGIPVYIGEKADAGGGHLPGSLDDVRVYSRALSASEIERLYNLGVGTHQATTITPPNLAGGLVGHWTFDGKDMNSDVSDTSGQGNDGTLSGATSTVPGVVGQALRFNGTNSAVTIGNSVSGVSTVSFWAEPSSLTQSVVDLNGTQSVDISAGTVRGNSFTSPTIYVDGAQTSSFPSDGKWHLVTVTTSTAINASALVFGKIGAAFYSGALDDVRIYSRALSASEIMQLYKLGH